MNANWLTAAALAAVLPAAAQQASPEAMLKAAQERLSKPVDLSGEVIAPTIPVPAAAGAASGQRPHDRHHKVQVQAHVHTPSQTGWFKTPFGTCSFSFSIGTSITHGAIHAQCDGGEGGAGNGGWSLQPDGSILAHIKTISGHEYNFKL